MALPHPSPFSECPPPFSLHLTIAAAGRGADGGGLGEGARIRGMDQPMKRAGGEQKGGGWEEEEEGEGVRANRLWSPHKDWPRTEGEDREVGGNWERGRGDPLLPCPRNRPPPGSCSPSLGASAQAGGDRTPIPVSFPPRIPLIPLPSMGIALPFPLLFSPRPLPLLESPGGGFCPLPTSDIRPLVPPTPSPHAHTPSPTGAPSCVCVCVCVCVC